MAERERAQSVEGRALRGVPWSLLAYAASRAIALLGTLALARLLAPDDLGVFFTGMVFLALINLLSDTGLGVTLVTREEVDDHMIGTVLVCMIIAGLLFASVFAALAHPIADLIGTPRLGDILPALALAAVFSTVGYFFLSLLQREMQFQRRFAGQFAQSIVYIGVAVPMAATGSGIWSLIVGTLAGAFVSSVVLWMVTPRRVRPSFSLSEARSIYREARPFISQAATGFVTYNAHLFAVASILGPAVMGAYSLSFRLAELPQVALTTPVAQATFPAFARLRDEVERAREALLTSLQYVTLAAFPVSFGLVAFGDPFQDAVLGGKWDDMPPILAVLGVWGALAALNGTMSWYANATGGAAWLARLYFRFALIAPAAFVIAEVTDSAEAVGALLLVGIAVELALLLRYIHAELALPFGRVWVAIRPALVGSAGLVAAGTAAWMGAESAGASAPAQLLIGILAGLGAYLGGVALVDRALLGRGRDLLRRSVASQA